MRPRGPTHRCVRSSTSCDAASWRLCGPPSKVCDCCYRRCSNVPREVFGVFPALHVSLFATWPAGSWTKPAKEKKMSMKTLNGRINVWQFVVYAWVHVNSIIINSFLQTVTDIGGDYPFCSSLKCYEAIKIVTEMCSRIDTKRLQVNWKWATFGIRKEGLPRDCKNCSFLLSISQPQMFFWKLQKLFETFWGRA